MAIVVTGAAGFIASGLVKKLNEHGYTNLILVDDFSKTQKANNLLQGGKLWRQKIDRKDFFRWFAESGSFVECVFHLGARTDTTEFDYEVFEELNVSYSKKMWEFCTTHQVPLIYASSAATYGGGEFGYKDEEALADKLQPLNPYGVSKNEFDKWAIQQKETPPFWAGLKFFNVYGPNEYHKGRMASVIFHSFNQIKANGGIKLFRSHRPDFKDGQQLRDFIYVKDLCEVCLFLMHKQPTSGLYNLGTGKARSFLDLAKAVFAALHLPENISFVDTPIDIRDKYQYFTEAAMSKLRKAGYELPFTTLENGVQEYVQQYLAGNEYW
jgi:ADP-L-glycero-D-manno-heptose 6-epimerase